MDTRRKFFKVRRQQQLERQVHAYESWIDKAGKTLFEQYPMIFARFEFGVKLARILPANIAAGNDESIEFCKK